MAIYTGKGKRKYVRVPSGKVRIRKAKKKTGKRVCALCGNELKGVPHGLRNYEVRQLAKTERRPEALFGGVLCSKCRERVLLEALLKKYVDSNRLIKVKYKPYVDTLLKRV